MQLLPLGRSPQPATPAAPPTAPRDGFSSAKPTHSPPASAPLSSSPAFSLALLLEQILNPCTLPDFEIIRRNAIAHLVILQGQGLQAQGAIETIATCLTHPDPNTQAQAIWAMGELNCQNPAILQQLTQLLHSPQAPHRLLLHTLTRLNYRPALTAIQHLQTGQWLDPNSEAPLEAPNALVQSAAIAALYRLSTDPSSLAAHLTTLTSALRHPDPQRRDAAFEDLLLTQDPLSLQNLSTSSGPLLTRLHALRNLADQGYANGQISFIDFEPIFDTLLENHAQRLHPCPIQGPGTPLYHAAYQDLLKTLEHPQPARLSEQLSAAIALGNWGQASGGQASRELLHPELPHPAPHQPPHTSGSHRSAHIALMQTLLPTNGESRPWELSYACCIALHRLGHSDILHHFSDHPDWILRGKSLSLLHTR